MFITFEGVDGSGKSTAVKRFAEILRTRYGSDRVVVTRDPGGTDVAADIRNVILSNDIDPVTELLLYTAARREIYVNIINPALMQNKIVISDRYIDSTKVYQWYARQGEAAHASMGDIKDLHIMACSGIMPDLTFVLNATTQTVKDRINARPDESNRFDLMGEEFFDRIIEGFYKTSCVEKERCKGIDANACIDDVQQEVMEKFDEFLISKASKHYITNR